MVVKHVKKTQKQRRDELQELYKVLENNCIDLRTACIKTGVDYYKLRKKMRADDVLTNRVKLALSTGADRLVNGLQKDVRGKIFLLSRVYADLYGKNKEENLPIDIPNNVAQVLQDKDSSPEAKIEVVNHSLQNGEIGRLDYEFLIKTIKNQHPLHFKAMSQEIKLDLTKLADIGDKVLI